jgi:hypothetical protein
MVLALLLPTMAASMASLPLFSGTAAAQPAAAGDAASPATAANGDAGGATPKTTTAGDAGAAVTTTGRDAAAPAASVVVDMSKPGTTNGVDGSTYAVRLRDLEQRVDELKDQIRRSHTRLALLSDTIIGGGAAGSRSEITYHNEMSSAFRLTRALFVLDGAVQYNRTDDTGALADQKEIPIFSGSIPPGDHTISVLLNFQGNGYGVFTYLRGYKFEVKSSHSFTAVEGKTLSISATSLEKGGVTTPLEQRPAIEWHEKVQPLAGGGAGSNAAAPAPGAAAPASTGGVSGGASFSVGGSK